MTFDVERPRIAHIPPYGTSAGEEAVELAAASGLILDPWQKYVLRNSLGERADGRWSAFEVGLAIGRQQGKGAVLEARELAGLVLFNDKLIMHTSQELKTSMEHFQRLEELFRNSDSLGKKVRRITRSNGKEGLEMMNGCRLTCLSRTKSSGRGFSGDLVILDEAYALTGEQINATLPTTLARDNAQVWYTSSPPLDEVSGDVLMRLRKRGEAGNAPRLAYFDYGIEGTTDRLDEVDLDDVRLWEAALPAMRSGRVRKENVQVLRDTLTDDGFAREILGMWPPSSSGGFQVIPAQDWTDAMHEESELEGPYVLSASVTVDRSMASIVACGRNLDGKEHVEVTSTGVRSDNRPGTSWVIPRIVAICKRRAPIKIVMDDFGPTGSLIADVERALQENSVWDIEVERMGTAAMTRAYGMFYDRVSGRDRDGRTLVHIGQTELTTAVAGATRRPLGDGFAWDRRSATVDISPLVGATTALYGWLTRPEDYSSFEVW